MIKNKVATIKNEELVLIGVENPEEFVKKNKNYFIPVYAEESKFEKYIYNQDDEKLYVDWSAEYGNYYKKALNRLKKQYFKSIYKEIIFKENIFSTSLETYNKYKNTLDIMTDDELKEVFDIYDNPIMFSKNDMEELLNTIGTRRKEIDDKLFSLIEDISSLEKTKENISTIKKINL